MKKFSFLIIASIAVATLMGCSYKTNIKYGNTLSQIDTLKNDDSLDELVASTPRCDVAEYEANLKCLGNNIFNFNPLALADVCLENKSNTPIKWTIKAENEDISPITGILEVGEKTPSEMYLLEKGNYQLSLEGNKESKISFEVKVKQLN